MNQKRFIFGKEVTTPGDTAFTHTSARHNSALQACPKSPEPRWVDVSVTELETGPMTVYRSHRRKTGGKHRTLTLLERVALWWRENTGKTA